MNLGVTLASNASKYVSFTKAPPRIGEAWAYPQSRCHQVSITRTLERTRREHVAAGRTSLRCSLSDDQLLDSPWSGTI